MTVGLKTRPEIHNLAQMLERLGGVSRKGQFGGLGPHERRHLLPGGLVNGREVTAREKRTAAVRAIGIPMERLEYRDGH